MFGFSTNVCHCINISDNNNNNGPLKLYHFYFIKRLVFPHKCVACVEVITKFAELKTMRNL